MTGDPGPSVDFKLLSEGCIAPIGNLRIKEAAEAFEAQVKATKVISFTKDDISDRDEYLLEYANQLGVVVGGATGAGGDAPKLLVVQARDGGFYLEGDPPGARNCQSLAGEVSPGSDDAGRSGCPPG